MFYNIAGLYPSENGMGIQVHGSKDINTLNFILMQYTGLKDKNGKEIYEGDIVKGFYGFGHGEWWMTASVFYDFVGFRLKVIDGDERQVNYADFIEKDGTIFEQKEIIGNIYENPDLLTP